MDISLYKWDRDYEHRRVKEYAVNVETWSGQTISIRFEGTIPETGKGKIKREQTFSLLGRVVLPEKVALTLAFKVIETLVKKKPGQLTVHEK